MLTLTDVKINGEYEYIEATAPTTSEKAPSYEAGDRWLDTTTGYSYILEDDTVGTWSRTYRAKDAKFTATYAAFEKGVFEYLSNPFLVNRNVDFTGDLYGEFSREEVLVFLKKETTFSEWVFDSSGKTITASDVDNVYGSLISYLQAGDIINVFGGVRNSGFFTVASINTSIAEITVTEDLTDETVRAFIGLAAIPDALPAIMGRMMYYDLFQRTGGSIGLKSEHIGTYSYTKDSPTIAGMRYPAEVAGDLDEYALIPIGGISDYVD